MVYSNNMSEEAKGVQLKGGPADGYHVIVNPSDIQILVYTSPHIPHAIETHRLADVLEPRTHRYTLAGDYIGQD